MTALQKALANKDLSSLLVLAYDNESSIRHLVEPLADVLEQDYFTFAPRDCHSPGPASKDTLVVEGNIARLELYRRAEGIQGEGTTIAPNPHHPPPTDTSSSIPIDNLSTMRCVWDRCSTEDLIMTLGDHWMLPDDDVRLMKGILHSYKSNHRPSERARWREIFHQQHGGLERRPLPGTDSSAQVTAWRGKL